MKLRVKQTIDFWLGSLLLLLLRPFTRLLGILSSRDHSLDIRGSVLFIKLQGGGSLLIAYPFILSIAESNPNAKLVLLTTKSVEPFAQLTDLFDEILIINDSSISSMVLSSLKALSNLIGRIDTVIDLEIYSRLSTVVALFTCARNRISAYLEDVFLREWISTHLIFFNRYAPIYSLYEQIAYLFCDKISGFEYAQLKFKNNISSVLGYTNDHSSSVNGDFILLPTCSELGTERMLSKAEWTIALSSFLDKSEKVSIVTLGTKNDVPFIDDLVSHLKEHFPKHNFINLAGKTSLIDASKIIYQSQKIFAIDSGLLHVARLLQKDVISYWGPTDPRLRLMSISERDNIKYNQIICSPCVHVAERPPCGGRNLCIKSLFSELTAQEIRNNITIRGVLMQKDP